MNQKNYKIFLCSLLLASFTVLKSASRVEDMDYDTFPFMVSEDELGMSNEDVLRKRESEQDNFEWAKKYAAQVARSFASDNIYQINRKQLLEYIEKYIHIHDDTEIVKGDDAYKLGVVNGLLKKYASQKDLHNELSKFFKHKSDKADAKEYPGYLNQIVNKFKQDNIQVVDKWNDIIRYAEKLSLPSRFIDYLKGFSVVDKQDFMKSLTDFLQMYPREFKKLENELIRKGKNIEVWDKVVDAAEDLDLHKYFIYDLKNNYSNSRIQFYINYFNSLIRQAKIPFSEREVSRALVLSHEVEKENNRQGRGFEDRKRRQDAEKVAQASRALDLAHSLTFSHSPFKRVDFGHTYEAKQKERVARVLDLAYAVAEKNEDVDMGERQSATDFSDTDHERYGSEHGSSDEDIDSDEGMRAP
jgi:hypothetical protein